MCSSFVIMATPWQKLPVEYPADGVIVWCRLWSVYGDPVLMQWDNALKVFVDQSGSDLVAPWWIVARWREQDP